MIILTEPWNQSKVNVMRWSIWFCSSKKKTGLQRNGDFGNVQHRRSSTARTLSQANVTPIDLQCPNLAGKQPGPKHLLGKINIDWFKTCTPEHEQLKEIDQAFRLLRMIPLKLFEAEIEKRPSQTVPGWTVYHATITTKQTSIKTAIGYCPVIPTLATDFNTVYSMMKYFQRLFSALGQQWTYVTYDEAIYCKAQKIKWRNQCEVENDEIEMGGLHHTMNVMGCIGHIMDGSELSEILVESGLYGTSAVGQIFRGKSYNRGMRVHELMIEEALDRLRWEAFCDWLAEGALSVEENHHIVTCTQACLDFFKDLEKVLDDKDTKENIREANDEFVGALTPLHRLMTQFSDVGRSSSYTFLFWDNYTKLSQLLLDYAAAKRDGNKHLEVEAFAEMIPYDFMCGHINYARWGITDVSEKKILMARYF